MAAIGGWIWWLNQREETAAKRGETLLAAFDGLARPAIATPPRPSSTELARIGDVAGYRAAALFAQANARPPPATARPRSPPCQQVADDQDLDEAYRHAALVRQTQLEFDRLPPQQVVHRLRPLARPGERLARLRRRDARRRLYEAATGPSWRGRSSPRSREDKKRAGFDPLPAPSRWRALCVDAIDSRPPSRRRARAGRPRSAGSGRNKGQCTMKRFVFALAASSASGGCCILRGHHRPTTPTVGQRIPVLGTDATVEADPTLADVPVTIPGARRQCRLAAARRQPVQVDRPCRARRRRPAQAWSVSIGAGDSAAGRLAAEPVVADGRIYTIDTMARVRAFAADTGATIWEHQVRGAHSQRETLYWRRRQPMTAAGSMSPTAPATSPRSTRRPATRSGSSSPGGPLRGAPTIANDTV